MGCRTTGYVDFGKYALVSYIQSPLGKFLDELRLDLAPACQPRAHVTVLPPRWLKAPENVAKAELRDLVSQLHAFEVKLGDIELFPVTDVVYVAIEAGAAELRRMHRILNVGAAESEEPYAFHPHITVAQNLPDGDVQAILKRARDLWRPWPGKKSFTVEELSFVQNREHEGWVDLMHFPLASEPVEVAG
jgi:2'-5' RNA ligase